MAVVLDFPTSEPSVTERHLSLTEDLALPSPSNFKCVSKTRSKTRSTVSALAINEAFLYKRELFDITVVSAFFSSLCHRCQQRDSPTQSAGADGSQRQVSRLLLCYWGKLWRFNASVVRCRIMIRDVMSLPRGSRKDRSMKPSRKMLALTTK